MNVFLDTTSKDFLLVLFDNNYKVIWKSYYENEVKKVNLIVNEFQKMLQENNLQVSQIQKLYTNVGPGYFTGVRSAIVLLKTLALSLNIDFYIANTFDLLMIQNKTRKTFKVDAQGNKIYFFSKNKFLETGDILKSVTVKYLSKNTKLDFLNYLDMANNLKKYIPSFKKTNPNDVNALYIKDPQIGNKKW